MSRIAIPLALTLSTQAVASAQFAMPPAIAQLKSQIQGKRPREVASIIVQRFGRPNRDVGSGLTILEWDVGGCVLSLTVEGGGGPLKFRCPDGATLWLIGTENPIRDNIISQFEMTTLPDLGNSDVSNHGTQFYLGYLALHANGKYRYVAADEFASQHRQIAPNFFFDHPRGNYVVAYPTGLSGQSLLENLPDKSHIAAIHFSADPKPGSTRPGASAQLELCTSRGHSLYFASSGLIPLNYALDASWHNRWSKSAHFEWNYFFPQPLNAGN